MAANPTTSVVIPCKGHAEELSRCLESLRGQAPGLEHETIVVDSAVDQRVEEVVHRFDEARLERGDPGLLAGAARNLGTERASGDYVAFIDADCQAEPGWLASAVRALRGGATMVGGPVLDTRPWHPVAATDNLLQFADFPRHREEGPARYFPGCNMAIRRADFVSVGGFPDVPTVAGEDTVLCDRVLERWPEGLTFIQEMRVRHDGRSGFLAFLRHQTGFGRARGSLGLHLSESQVRWGRLPWVMPAVVAKRLGYIARRQAAWESFRALRLIPLAPLVMLGLVAWAEGFRRGCGERLVAQEQGVLPTSAGHKKVRP